MSTQLKTKRERAYLEIIAGIDYELDKLSTEEGWLVLEMLEECIEAKIANLHKTLQESHPDRFKKFINRISS